MLLIGLLLVAATAAFTGLLIADNLSGGPEYQVTILGHQLVTLSSLGVFLAGLALALLFCLGLALAAAARRRRRVHRTDRRDRRAAAAPRRAPGTRERVVDAPPAEERVVEKRVVEKPAADEPVGDPVNEPVADEPATGDRESRTAGSGGGRLRHFLGR
ncbi:hypothetical protein [Kitasatospora sp. NPDC015120]|uniref:hypothetical protein n=1 Tax=Kitasatospora sp. NPDC015120 TaxID=3364023 RepID=UPI0036F4A13B